MSFEEYVTQANVWCTNYVKQACHILILFRYLFGKDKVGNYARFR